MVPSVLANEPREFGRDGRGETVARDTRRVADAVDHQGVAVTPDLRAVRHAVVGDEGVAAQGMEALGVVERRRGKRDGRVAGDDLHEGIAAGEAPGEGQGLRARRHTRGGERGERLSGARGEHQPQRLPRDAVGERVHPVARGAYRDAELFTGERGELRGEAVDGATVAHRAMPVERSDGEAQPGARRCSVRCKLRAPHRVERGRLYHHRARRAAPAGEEDAHEAREVGHGAVHAPGGRHAELEVRRGKAASVKRPHDPVRHAPDERALRFEGTRLESHRVEHRSLEILREGFLSFPLEQVAYHADAGVRVLAVRLRGIDQRRRVERGHRLGQRRPRVVEVVAGRRLAHEPGKVRHQLPQRDRRPCGIARLELAEIARDRRIQLHRPALDQLHDADVGEQLRDRSYAIDGLRARRRPARRVLHAEPCRPDDPLVVDQCDGEGGNFLGLHLPRDEGAERVGDVLVARILGLGRGGELSRFGRRFTTRNEQEGAGRATGDAHASASPAPRGGEDDRRGRSAQQATVRQGITSHHGLRRTGESRSARAGARAGARWRRARVVARASPGITSSRHPGSAKREMPERRAGRRRCRSPIAWAVRRSC